MGGPPRLRPASAKEPTMHAREMIGTHPAVQGQVNDALIRCI